MADKYDDVLLPFLSLMRKELHANSRKGDRPGWLGMDANTALLEVYWHTAKLSAAVKNNDGSAIMEHSADVANMALMVLDICGGLGFVEAEPSPTAALRLRIGKLRAALAQIDTDSAHDALESDDALNAGVKGAPALADQIGALPARFPEKVVTHPENMGWWRSGFVAARDQAAALARTAGAGEVYGSRGERSGAAMLERTRGVAADAAPVSKESLDRFERGAFRMGELWERCQGKGWPDAESDEFTKLRDERMPALRAELRAARGVDVPDGAQR